jgi:HD superfamily phosphodiesterase
LVVYPTFAGRRGHPPVISATLIPAILDYEGAGGLETLLRQHRGLDVAVWDEGIHIDADTPEDLQRLQQRQAHIAIPTRREAEALAELQLSDQGLAHGRLVGRVALAIAQALDDKGITLNMDLIYGAALLHDVAKGQPRHEILGAEILSSLGLPEIAEIVASHKDLDAPANGKPTEKEIVCLADKLISGTRRVRIKERYAEKLLLFKKNSGMYQEIMGRKKRALALKALVEKAAAKSLESILKKSSLQS